MKSICVFCGSHVGEKMEYPKAAAKLGKILAEKDIGLVYGGSENGLMGMVAKGSLEHGGHVTGVITRKLAESERAHPNLSELKIVDSMHQRKALMAELADGFIALPGGIGTLEETLEMFTWVQLGIHNKPVGLLNTLGFYDSLSVFLQHVVQEGFLRSDLLELLLIESDAELLVNRLSHH